MIIARHSCVRQVVAVDRASILPLNSRGLLVCIATEGPRNIARCGGMLIGRRTEFVCSALRSAKTHKYQLRCPYHTYAVLHRPRSMSLPSLLGPDEHRLCPLSREQACAVVCFKLVVSPRFNLRFTSHHPCFRPPLAPWPA